MDYDSSRFDSRSLTLDHRITVFSLFLYVQIRDKLAAEGAEPLEEEIPHEDIVGRDYCRYSIKNLMAP